MRGWNCFGLASPPQLCRSSPGGLPAAFRTTSRGEHTVENPDDSALTEHRRLDVVNAIHLSFPLRLFPCDALPVAL